MLMNIYNVLKKRIKEIKGGFSVAEVIVAVAVITVVFVGVFNSISNMRKVNDQANYKLVGHNQIIYIADEINNTTYSDYDTKAKLINDFITDSNELGFSAYPGEPFVFTKMLEREKVRLVIDMRHDYRIQLLAERKIEIDDNPSNDVYRRFDDVFVWKSYSNWNER